jgi:hypothetical protein
VTRIDRNVICSYHALSSNTKKLAVFSVFKVWFTLVLRQNCAAMQYYFSLAAKSGNATSNQRHLNFNEKLRNIYLFGNFCILAELKIASDWTDFIECDSAVKQHYFNEVESLDWAAACANTIEQSK